MDCDLIYVGRQTATLQAKIDRRTGRDRHTVRLTGEWTERKPDNQPKTVLFDTSIQPASKCGDKWGISPDGFF